jgi:tetratricopeptide (TPR) repeat protein
MIRVRPFLLLAAGVVASLSPSAFQPGGADTRERADRENNLGVARLEQFDYRAAAAQFRRALDIDPRLAAARLNLAIALLYDAQADEAEREARAASEALPDSPRPPYVRGLIARLAGRDDEASAQFLRAVALDPRDAGARVQLGQVLVNQRRYDEAVASFAEAQRTEPFNATAAYGMATALTRAGRAGEGQAAMTRFERLRDNPASFTYSSDYLGQGRYAEAIASTGLEPELIDRAIPPVAFADATSAIVGSVELGSNSTPRTVRLGDLVDVSGGPAAALDRIAASSATGVTLADIDADGELDLLLVSGSTVIVRRARGARFENSARADINVPGTLPIAVVAGDYDNDGRADLFVLGHPAHRLFHQSADGTFQDVTTAAAIPAPASFARTAAFVDIDHDGDLDLFLGGLAGVGAPGAEARFPQAFGAAPNQLLRNAGNGRFVDVTAEARLMSTGGHAVAIVPTDYDNHRDIDLLVVNFGAPPALLGNARDGTFRDASADAGLPRAADCTSVAAGDVNKDGATDFLFGRAGAAALLAMSSGDGRFTVSEAPAGTSDVVSAHFIDYDNDGILDLLALTAGGPRLWRKVGNAWVDVTATALPAGLAAANDRAEALATADVDGDGDTDMVVRTASGRVRVWRNDGGNRRPSMRVRLQARVSNRSAAGAKVELRAGSLLHRTETMAATPAAGPSDIVFGLGGRARADVVRVLWPAGILQAETNMPPPRPRTNAATMSVVELDRKPSSCPYLYTWNGTRFEFVTDFMGGGEMGSWAGPGAHNVPDPDEYVRISPEQLRERAGRYDLRVTNELEEAMFVDRLQLLAVAHPADVDVYPNEGLKSPGARRPFTLYTAGATRAPLAAVDEHGHDVRDLIAQIDRRYVDDFALEPVRGYAQEHAVTLTLDLAEATRALLLLTGWTDYAFSSDNVAAHQAGLRPAPPSVQMRDGSGRWRTVVSEAGMPVGRPQTIVVDLTAALKERRPKARASTVDIRIATTLRVYWDQIVVDTSSPVATTAARLDPQIATLRWRGYSAETTPDGREPFGFDYERVLPQAPWKTMPGLYTRFGDVTPLLSASDDRFVVSAPGDEIALSFDAASFAPLPDGWTRTLLLYVDGFSKEMNLRSASPDRLDPLPFHGMTRYPYPPRERYPETPDHDRYRSSYNTRRVGGPIPRL